MKLHSDIAKIKRNIEAKTSKSADKRQSHFDSVAVEMGFRNSNEAYKVIGKSFLESAKINAPSI